MMKIILPSLLLTFVFCVSVNESRAQAAVGEEKPSKKQVEPLAKRIHYLASGSQFTRIPKGSLANLPERFANRILSSPPKGSKYTRFSDFLKQNRGWVRNHELTLAQMKTLPKTVEQIRENKSNLGYVVIFTHKNNPVGFGSLTQK